jgi:hypothetical protein
MADQIPAMPVVPALGSSDGVPGMLTTNSHFENNDLSARRIAFFRFKKYQLVEGSIHRV